MRFLRKRNVTLLLGRMELIVVDLNTDVELDATECTVVTGAALITDTNLSSGHGRWMERSRNRRREYGRGYAGEQPGLNPSYDHEQGT